MDINQIKTDIATVKQTIADEKVQVQTSLVDLRKQVQDLTDQIAAGNPVTAQDLADIDASILDINTGVGQISEPNPATIVPTA